MCKYSLESFATRSTTAGETLVANQHQGASGHGCLTRDAQDRTLTCVQHGTLLTIEKLEFSPQHEVLIHNRSHYCQGDVLALVGQRVVVKMIDGRNLRHGMDSLATNNGEVFPLVFLKPGTPVYVGVKAVAPTLDEKLALDAQSLRAMAADMNGDPEPKPEDDKPQEQEPAKEPTPAEPPREAKARGLLRAFFG